MPNTRAANPAADPRVGASGRSLTHLEVRSLTSSAPPSARLAGSADPRFRAANPAADPRFAAPAAGGGPRPS